MKIGNREVGPGEMPYVVAEIGANHEGSLEKCLATIEAAKRSGADAVKLQAYTADTITLRSVTEEFHIKDGPWKGQFLWDLYKKCETPFEWFPEIAACAKDVGITWFASVFDSSSVDMLEKLECPAYKIASFEITDIPLIKYAARLGKPVILSTGMASRREVLTACTAVYHLNDNLIPLHCVSAYPAKPKDYDLGQIRNLYGDCCFGISDHTLGIEIPIAATALGACMIEKHFCLPNCGSEDAEFSMRPEQFARMTKAVLETWSALQPTKRRSDDEHRPYRRSLFVVQDVKQGELFTHENVRSIRPGHGLPPVMIDEIVGKKALRDIERGEPMAWGMFESRSPIRDPASYSGRHI